MKPNPPHGNWHRRWSLSSHLPLPDFGLATRNAWTIDDVPFDGNFGFDFELDSDEVEQNESGIVFLDEETAIFLPERYESRYAYPLIVWLTDCHHSQSDLLDMMPHLSSQNILAFAIETGGVATDSQSSKPNQNDLAGVTLNAIRKAFQLVRKEYHIHSERIYVAGFGQAASLALQVFLRQPQWFAGVMSLDGLLDSSQSLAQFNELHGKRLLLGINPKSDSDKLADNVQVHRLLHSAGMEVTTRNFDGGVDCTGQILSEINHWIVSGIYESDLV